MEYDPKGIEILKQMKPVKRPNEMTGEEWYKHWLDKGWKHESCGVCSGSGLIGTFGGPDECRSCNGAGSVWRTPKGRYVEYPGRRFV